MNIKERIKRLPQTEETLKDLFALAVEDDDMELNRWVRREAKKIISADAYDIVRKTYILGGRHSFDDYMIACEWNREPQARFWLPRRKVLEGQHKIATKIQEFIDDPDSLYLGFSMPPGTGKALANDTPVLTRNGWKNHGDLVVGDEVIGMDGEFKKVLRVFPKCMMDCKVEFSNGESIVCHENHEWLIHNLNCKKDLIRDTKYLENRSLSNNIVGRGHRYKTQVPRRAYVKGETKELGVPPYTLGAWLGDGINRNPTICGDIRDAAIIDRVMQDGYEIAWTTIHKTTGVKYYGIKGLRQDLQKYGMCHSRRVTPKRIPQEYLTASVEQRLQLLAGLLDTDGCRCGNKYQYSTVQEELRDSFVDLVSTFGWRTCVCAAEPKVSTSGIVGRRVCYTIQFTPDCEIPCVLDRRKIQNPPAQRKIAFKKVSRIAPVEGNCIEVEGGLYLAGKTLIPTHNSTLIKFLLAYVEGKYPKSANMYVSYSDSMIKMMLDAEKAILTDVNEYAHNEIFPDNGAPDISAEYKTISHRRKGDFPTIGLVSLGGSVTGRTRANKFLITDDLVKDAEMARSPERLDRLYHDYKDTLTTRKIGDNVKEIQLGTIWSVHDPISRKKREFEGDPRYKFIAIPVCDENGKSNFYYDHPDRYSDEKIAEIKKDLDPVSFSCLYMQRGIEREGLALPSDELLYYNGVLPDGEPDNILFACDVAWGGGDSLAMPLAYVYGGDVYVSDVIFDQRDKTHTRPRVIGKILHHRCKMGRFEANNGGDEYADKVSDELKAAGYACNISHKKAPSTQGKLARIEQYVPDIKKFYFLSPEVQSDEYRKFMDEATSLSFTSKNLHDDAADSLAQLAAFINGGVRSAVAFRRPF